MKALLAEAALLALLGLVAACGAKTGLHAPSPSAGGAGGAGTSSSSSTSTGGERQCAPNCTVGHHCCVGGCSGPAAPTPNDCCTCLPGEVSSIECDFDECGL
jgi:hypothetical protein